VVPQDSAAGGSGSNIQKIGILADHRDMIKFDSHNPEYRYKVEPALSRMVSKALISRKHSSIQIPQNVNSMALLRVPRENFQSTRRQRVVNVFEIGDPEGNNMLDGPDGNTPRQAAMSSLEGVSGTDANAWLTTIHQEISSIAVRDQIAEVKTALAGTCGWIKGKEVYNQWLSSPNNAVLFIQAGAGFGKSVLAKHLVGELSNSPAGPERMIAYYFPQTGARGSTPRTILIHLLYQIHKEDPVSFESSALSLYNRFMTQQRDLPFYWALLTAVRSSLQSELICVIDGLDECIKASKTWGQTTVNTQMVSFLKRVCGISGEPGGTKCTKILFTTRSESEIEVAIRQVTDPNSNSVRPDVVLNIESEDVEEDVAAMIKNGVTAIAIQRGLSNQLAEFLTQKLIVKSGALFQLADFLLNFLRDSGSDLGSESKISQTLGRFPAKDIYKPYMEALERMNVDAIEKATKLIRSTYFAYWELGVMEMKDVLAVIPDDHSITGFNDSYEEDLEYFIRTHCGKLVDINRRSCISFRHSSIRDYLQELKDEDIRYGSFNCSNHMVGHLDLALVCIRYVLLAFDSLHFKQYLGAEEGARDYILKSDGKFLDYALANWPFHLREASNLIQHHLGLIYQLLDKQTPHRYKFPMYDCEQDDNKASFETWECLEPMFFIASQT
jgi:hypothetical protein